MDITETEDFLSLKSLLPKINESLAIDELTIFNVVSKWVAFDEEVRLKVLGTILPLISFSEQTCTSPKSKPLREFLISECKRILLVSENPLDKPDNNETDSAMLFCYHRQYKRWFFSRRTPIILARTGVLMSSNFSDP